MQGGISMLALLTRKEKRVQKVDLQGVCRRLSELFWEYEVVEGKDNVIAVKGKYRNHRRDYDRLYLHLFGGKVQFRDGRGYLITHISEFVDMRDMFKELKNILNVL